MINFFQNQKVKALFKTIRPWLSFLALLAILRFTGILSGLSFVTQSALIKTGIMDYNPSESESSAAFDYNFQVKDLEGNIVNISDLKGKTIFINLWATWCGPCRVEMPSIQGLYDQLDHDKIVFIMLSLDNEDHQAKVKEYIESKAFTLPVYQPNGYLPEQLNVSSIPTTFVISPEGKIHSKKVGTANYNTKKFKQYLEKLSGI